MSTATKVERKCDSCGQWVQGRQRICPICGGHMDHRQREEEEKERVKTEIAVKERSEFMSKPPIVRFFLKVGGALETAFIAIIGFFSALIFGIGG